MGRFIFMEVKIIFETFGVFMLFDRLKTKAARQQFSPFLNHLLFADDSDIISNPAFLLVNSICNRRSRYGNQES